MNIEYKITNTEKADLSDIFNFFEESIAYQEKNGYPAWKHYDKDVIRKDMENKLQYKIIIDGMMAMVFSVRYSDRLIWRDLDNEDSVYLHRIVVNPIFKGRKLFKVVLKWAIDHAKIRGLTFIRMDTWADNPSIIGYYETFGFTSI
ncbi:MAG TPA: GNAT family N-acetyltransferase, partial [Chryseolinea sp.]